MPWIGHGTVHSHWDEVAITKHMPNAFKWNNCFIKFHLTLRSFSVTKRPQSCFNFTTSLPQSVPL